MISLGKRSLSCRGRWVQLQIKCGIVQARVVRMNARKKPSIQIPSKKTWPNDGLLSSLSESTPMDALNNSFYPVATVDLASFRLKGHIDGQKARKSAKDVVEFLKNDGGDIFKLDWNSDSEMRPGTYRIINLSDVDDCPESETTSPSSVLDELMQKRDFKNLGLTFKIMLKKGTEIPIEWKEKVVAYLCFEIVAGRRERRKELEHSLSEIIAWLDVSKSMAAVILRSSSSHEQLTLTKWYGELTKGGGTLDTKTTDMILRNISEGDIAQSCHVADIENAVKSGKTRISAFNVLDLAFRAQSKKSHDREGIVSFLSRYVAEMKHCTAISDIDIYAAMLGYACRKLENKELVYAVLDLIDVLPPARIRMRSATSFKDAMYYARNRDDYLLAQRVFETAMKHNSPCSFGFFASYLAATCMDPSVEAYLGATTFLKGGFCIPSSTYGSVLKPCTLRNWPEVLPYVWAVYEDSIWPVEQHLPWIEAAIELSDRADPETLLQMRRICIILMHWAKRSRDQNFLSFLCILVCKCGDKDDVLNMLRIVKRLNKSAIKACEVVLGTDIDF